MSSPPLVPYPATVRARSGRFVLAGSEIAGEADAVAELARLVRARTSLELPLSGAGAVRVQIRAGGPAESYAFTVDDRTVTVTGADAAGLFYGVQTLAQAITPNGGEWVIPAMEVEDAPRFRYRGVMLDVARHFFAVDDVKAYIDRAASLKCNHLHLHLTDDQGWRLELRSRPELTARAAGSAVGGDPGGFYTREDYAQIVAYAASRHMTVVPEVDVPSHTHAVGLAYPGLAADPVISDTVRETAARFGGGLPQPGEAYTGMAVGFSSLRIGDERTYAFLADVFGELAALTPGPFVHLGGDEALGTSPEEYATFIARAVDLVAATGKTPIAWTRRRRCRGFPPTWSRSTGASSPRRRAPPTPPRPPRQQRPRARPRRSSSPPRMRRTST